MIQPSALNLVIVACMVLIIGFLLRTIAARNAESPWGQALATIY